MRTRKIESGGIAIGGDAPPLVIAGPDSLEGDEVVLEISRALRSIGERLRVGVVFKGSYDKANRSSHRSYRGPGLERGLAMLRRVREETGLRVTSDVHSVEEALRAAETLDIVQVPAFLSRQNDLLRAAGESGKIVNIKKGPFLAPWHARQRVEAAAGPRTPGVIVTERGTTFGHGDLVNDFRGVVQIRSEGIPVVYDASHSVQRPGGLGDRSGGNREWIPFLARAAAGAGCDGLFFEVHPRPDDALCDGPSSLSLAALEPLLEQIVAIDRIARGL
ncbi:MAG: 3-deoxy-8-phosphooctulonate synthase [Planctomycetes bacterium]|nr:3-deoxy-8-phosphooctulonate synthase [Planctomycetota bacterium]